MRNIARTPRLLDPVERVYRGPLDHPEVVAAKTALDEITAREKIETDRIAQARATLRRQALRRGMSEKGFPEKAEQLAADLLAGGTIPPDNPAAIIEAAELSLEILRPEKHKRLTAYRLALDMASFINAREHVTDVELPALDLIRHGLAAIKEGVDTISENKAQLLQAGNNDSGAVHPVLTAYALMIDAAIPEHDRMAEAFRANDARLKALGT